MVRTRYSCRMHKRLLILATWAASAGAWAQAAPQAAPQAQPGPVNPVSREQRRVELRTMLQAHRPWEASVQPAAAVPVERQLTERERAEIREQLRQQYSDRSKIQP